MGAASSRSATCRVRTTPLSRPSSGRPRARPSGSSGARRPRSHGFGRRPREAPGSRSSTASAIGWCWAISVGASADEIWLVRTTRRANDCSVSSWLSSMSWPHRTKTERWNATSASATTTGSPDVDGHLEGLECRLDLGVAAPAPAASSASREAYGSSSARRLVISHVARTLSCGHEDAAVRDGLDQPAVDERPQRLANRPARGVELAGQRHLREPGSGRESAMDDRVADEARHCRRERLRPLQRHAWHAPPCAPRGWIVGQ